MYNSDGPNSYFQHMWMRISMRIFYFNLCECKCEYYILIFANANANAILFYFYVYYFMTCDINWRIKFWICSEIDEPIDFNENKKINIVTNVVS